MALTKATYSMIVGAAVNVLDFGAVGDGVTDDLAAFNLAKAAAAATNRAIYIPAPKVFKNITSCRLLGCLTNNLCLCLVMALLHVWLAIAQLVMMLFALLQAM